MRFTTWQSASQDAAMHSALQSYLDTFPHVATVETAPLGARVIESHLWINFANTSPRSTSKHVAVCIRRLHAERIQIRLVKLNVIAAVLPMRSPCRETHPVNRHQETVRTSSVLYLFRNSWKASSRKSTAYGWIWAEPVGGTRDDSRVGVTLGEHPEDGNNGLKFLAAGDFAGSRQIEVKEDGIFVKAVDILRPSR